jgi:predicted RNA-binding Zn-ribbon protein involved in translation (DUF1610 family)
VTKSEFSLVALDCPSCGAGIKADGQDVVFYCTACRNGYRFEQMGRSLEPVEVSFVSLPNRECDRYLPFWLLPATIEILERTASGASFGGLMRFFFGGDADDSGNHEGTFAIPAFHAHLSAVTELVRRYTEAVPDLGERLGERLVGGCYGVDDAQKLAHYALVASEVGKPDTLQKFRYEIDFGPSRLLGVPFLEESGTLRDALFNIAL